MLKLNPTDHVAHINFCYWMLQSVLEGSVNPMLLFMTDKTWFHVHAFVNAQDTHHWNTVNPHAVYEVPFHNQKVGVWCAVSAWRIDGPVLLYDRGNSEHYVNNILEPFCIRK